MRQIQLSFLVLIVLISFNGVARADMLRLLADNADAAQVRVDLIQQAQREIRVQYFITGMDEDPYTLSNLALLRQAAIRGVKVKLILDASFHKLSYAMLAAILESSNHNLEIKLFNTKNPFQPATFSKRNHSKELNVDSHIMITGDRNASCEYFSDCPDKRAHYRSIDVLVEGSAAAKAAEVFDRLWVNTEVLTSSFLYDYASDKRNAPCVEDNCGAIEMRQRSIAKKIAEANERLDLALNYSPFKLETHTDRLASGYTQKNVRFLYDEPHQVVSSENRLMSVQLNQVIRENTKSGSQLTLLTPYLVPTNEVMSLLRELLAKGVHLKIITNSLASTDNVFTQAAYIKYRPELIRMGIEIWEFNGADSRYRGALTEHAKCLVIDGRVGVVSTYNIDPRSQEINREMGIAAIEGDDTLIDRSHPSFSQELEQEIEKFKDDATLVATEGHPTADLDKLDQFVSAVKMAEFRAAQLLDILPGLEGLL